MMYFIWNPILPPHFLLKVTRTPAQNRMKFSIRYNLLKYYAMCYTEVTFQCCHYLKDYFIFFYTFVPWLARYFLLHTSDVSSREISLGQPWTRKGHKRLAPSHMVNEWYLPVKSARSLRKKPSVKFICQCQYQINFRIWYYLVKYRWQSFRSEVPLITHIAASVIIETSYRTVLTFTTLVNCLKASWTRVPFCVRFH